MYEHEHEQGRIDRMNKSSDQGIIYTETDINKGCELLL